MMRKFVITALATAIGLTSVQAMAEFEAGKDYIVLENPEKIEGNQIIVREFFWYGCPHCYSLEPYMQKWAKTKPNDVVFMQTPAAMNPLWEQNARGFYAVQLMGHQEKTHEALFKAIQQDRQKLFDKQTLGKWYEGQGVDLEKFNNLYNSLAVNTKIARSQAGAQRYQLTGVPAVVVDGKYVVKTQESKVPEVINFLVQKVRDERKQK